MRDVSDEMLRNPPEGDWLASSAQLTRWLVADQTAPAVAAMSAARRDLRDIYLMMVTTESEQGQIVRALAAGAHEYVIKPFTDEIIADKLALLGLVAA